MSVIEYYFVSMSYLDFLVGIFIEELKEWRWRSVIEGGYQFSQVIVVVLKIVFSQCVIFVLMIFSKVVSFDEMFDV